MKPFDIELAKAGHPVQTRNGKPVRIICFDRMYKNYPIIALVEVDDTEQSYYYTNEGKLVAGANNDLDLFMATIKKRVDKYLQKLSNV